MGKKPTIFLSSTWSDLQEHRQALLSTFSRLRHWVETMEYFGARPRAPIAESLQAVRAADIYIGIIGTRYGSKDKNAVSITQLEYEEAYRCEKPIFIYIIDPENHPILPKFVDTGSDAIRLCDFKRMLQDRHVCESFLSAHDLAAKVGLDITSYLENIQHLTQEQKREIMKLLTAAGYYLGFQTRLLDLSHILSIGEDGTLSVNDNDVEELLCAGYIAINLSRGNFQIFKNVLAFDFKQWGLIVKITKHYGIDGVKVAAAIKRCYDPMEFRLLTKLAGDLDLSVCAESICQRLIATQGSIDRRFSRLLEEVRDEATPLRVVAGESLGAMSTDVLPIVEHYRDEAKRIKRWREKQTLDSVVRTLRKRLKK